MMFHRKPVERVVTPKVATTHAAPDDTSIPLVDTLGQGLELLRGLDLGHNLWRVELASDLDQLAAGQIVVLAAYTPADIDSSRWLMQRFMTIVFAIGLGPHYGSRALSLGAVGYVDAKTDDSEIQGLFGDAVARVRMRRARVAVA